MIVKERWKNLDDKEKVLFVVKARIEEERLHYENIKVFYQKRIEFAKSIPSLQMSVPGNNTYYYGMNDITTD